MCKCVENQMTDMKHLRKVERVILPHKHNPAGNQHDLRRRINKRHVKRLDVVPALGHLILQQVVDGCKPSGAVLLKYKLRVLSVYTREAHAVAAG